MGNNQDTPQESKAINRGAFEYASNPAMNKLRQELEERDAARRAAEKTETVETPDAADGSKEKRDKARETIKVPESIRNYIDALFAEPATALTKFVKDHMDLPREGKYWQQWGEDFKQIAADPESGEPFGSRVYVLGLQESLGFKPGDKEKNRDGSLGYLTLTSLADKLGMQAESEKTMDEAAKQEAEKGNEAKEGKKELPKNLKEQAKTLAKSLVLGDMKSDVDRMIMLSDRARDHVREAYSLRTPLNSAFFDFNSWIPKEYVAYQRAHADYINTISRFEGIKNPTEEMKARIDRASEKYADARYNILKVLELYKAEVIKASGRQSNEFAARSAQLLTQYPLPQDRSIFTQTEKGLIIELNESIKTQMDRITIDRFKRERGVKDLYQIVFNGEFQKEGFSDMKSLEKKISKKGIRQLQDELGVSGKEAVKQLNEIIYLGNMYEIKHGSEALHQSLNQTNAQAIAEIQKKDHRAEYRNELHLA